MKQIEYPTGQIYHSAAFVGGEFWVVTKTDQQDRTFVASSSGGFVSRRFDAPPPNSWYLRMPSLIDHPKKPGLSFAWFTPTESNAFHVKTGETFQITKENRPRMQDEGGTADYRELTRWVNATVGAYRIADLYGKSREAWNDQLVVMTGSSALSNASLVMGPTAAKSVVGTRGLKNGHVVAYSRASQTHRVMRLGSKHNPIHLVLADDGLTFMACCLRSAFVIDFDA